MCLKLLENLHSALLGRLLICFFCSLGVWSTANAQSVVKSDAKVPVIIAAANVRPVLEELVQVFHQKTKVKPQIIYGSSGHFYQQIIHGGKFDLFLSADEHFIRKLHEANLVANDGVVYAKGKLVVWLSSSLALTSKDVTKLKEVLVSSQVSKIAYANPTLAPYGTAAEHVLKNSVNWPSIQKKIILGENIGQVAQFALSGSVQVAFLPMSLTLHPQLQQKGFVLDLDEAMYQPILQRMVLLSSNPMAKDFYDFILDKSNRTIWEKYGYTLP